MATNDGLNNSLAGQTGTGSYAGSDSPQFTTQIDVDTLRIIGNTISSTNTNGSIIIEPNGNGTLQLNAAGILVENLIQHQGNTTTWINFQTNEVQIATNATERFSIDNNGMQLGNTNARVTTILDEDNMASDSATALATQQSIKAYVDNSMAGSGGFTSVVSQVFTSSGTYTPTAGMDYCIIEVLGGGGGGGGCSAGSNLGVGGGGGAGGYAKGVYSAATIGASQTVTIGAGGTGGGFNATGGTGGTTSVGAIISATGGTGGAGSAASTSAQVKVGGNAGAGAGGDLNCNTGYGHAAWSNGTIGISGQGGDSIYGSGGKSVVGSTASSNGADYYGAGGGGALSTAASNASGGAGASGLVIITEFVS